MPYELHFGANSPSTVKAEGWRRLLAEWGCTQRELAQAVGCTQGTVSKYLSAGGYRPPPLPPPTMTTAPFRPPPLKGGEAPLATWCAHVAARRGWIAAREHQVRSWVPGLRDCRVDLVLSQPGGWRPIFAIEVKLAIRTRSELQAARDQRKEYADRLRCEAMLVAGDIDRRLHGTRDVVLAEDLEWVIGSARDFAG